MTASDVDSFPRALRAHLQTDELSPLWAALRSRLERSGHAVRGAIDVEMDDGAANRLAGLLGRPVAAGRARIPLIELDTALRASSAGRGLVATVAELTGSPLRDKPAEKVSSHEDWARVWQGLDDNLARVEVASSSWAARWVQWLHTSGAVTRLGALQASTVLQTVVAVLAEISPALRTAVDVDGVKVLGVPVTAVTATDVDVPARSLGELASRATGSAHGLDDGRAPTALILRAIAIALDWPAPTSAVDRRALWTRIGIESDRVSSTVLVWALRPPGHGSVVAHDV